MAPFPRGLLVRGPGPRSASTPRQYGLLDVVQPNTPQDIHWQVSGVEWEDFLCTSLETFIDACPPATGIVKSTERDLSFCHADPFSVKGSYQCATGGRPAGEAFEIARQRLLAWEGHDVEEAFWTGLAVNGTINPSLQAGNDTCEIEVEDLTAGGAVDPVEGIALLEAALGDAVPFPGVIHVPYDLAAYLAHHDLLNEEGDNYISPTGSSYVLGSGYPGTGPGNSAAPAGTSWIFATGPVGVWRSNVYQVPDDISESVDRQINNVTVYAERVYSVGFSCAVFAVNVEKFTV